MIQISQIKLQIPHTEEKLKEKVLKLLRLREKDLISFRILKKSLDARKKPQLFYVYTVEVRVRNENRIKKQIKNNTITFHPEKESYKCEATGIQPLCERPVIIGTGPAGLFCGYQLALLGYRPILLERGASVDERITDVENFWQGGELKKNSNVQFGEGGAGTFSDGKLNTLVNDKFGRNQEVLRIFTKYGAPDRIQYESKPHIGTDVLAEVVKNMRNTIISLGGEVRFHSQVTDLLYSQQGNMKMLESLEVLNLQTNTTEQLKTNIAVLAIGHSARDTFEMLLEQKIPMEAKPFAVGVRMEHPQSMINESQYGAGYPESLPAAPYKLAANLENGRGVYTFCMCPGGYVVNASSEKGRLAINGMSYHNRASANANSAIVVTVSPEDYGSNPLDGMEFQRHLEENAYKLGNGKIPIQLLKDFHNNVETKKLGNIFPIFKGDYTYTNLNELLPKETSIALKEAFHNFDKKIKGFNNDDTILAGIESRTSSPIRIPRNNQLESIDIKGLYPCGEGAGYAGGITTSAMDGLKVAEKIIAKYYFKGNIKNI